jgi:hypothetical protein
MHHYIRHTIKSPSKSSRSAADSSLGATRNIEEEEKKSKRKICNKEKRQKKKGKFVSLQHLSRSNTPVTSVEPSRHTPDALLPAALKIALLVELPIAHVALEVRSRATVVAEKLLNVKELALRSLVADFLAVFVGFAVFRDVVWQGFGRSGVRVRAAGFGAPDGSVGRSREGDGGSFGDGCCGADGDDDERGRNGHGDGDAVDVFRGGGWGEAFVGGRGGCDEAGDVDG